MSGCKKRKSEFSLESGAVGAWLRQLADAVDAGELPDDSGSVCLAGYTSFKVSFKDGLDGRVRAKLSVKFPNPAGQPGFPGEEEEAGEAGDTGMLPKYKTLKKHMKQTFKAIGAALNEGRLPPAREAKSFIADSLLMVSYPGLGEEYYGVYEEKVRAFEAALASGDVDALKTVYAALAQLKRECHSRHA